MGIVHDSENGAEYFGVYRYEPNVVNMDLRGNWGVHHAKMRLVDGALNVRLKVLSRDSAWKEWSVWRRSPRSDR